MLRDYLKEGISPYDFPHLLEKFFEQQYGELPENFDQEEPYIHLDGMNEAQLKEFKAWLERSGNLSGEHEDAMSPSYMHLQGAQIVPPETWLVHFSDQAEDIGTKGFQFGHEDMQTLGLTTHFVNRKKGAGWNFAFEALSRYARNAARTGKYGNSAVLFRCAGVKSYHAGDQEDQIIFLGSAAKDIVHIAQGENWTQHSSSNEWSISSRNGRLLFQSDYDSVVLWVMNNFDQYRSVIAR